MGNVNPIEISRFVPVGLLLKVPPRKSEVRKWAENLTRDYCGRCFENLLRAPNPHRKRERVKHCNAMTKRDLLEKYRRGKIIERIWPDGARE